MKHKITAQIVKRLILPKKTSHKGENGKLLVIAGSPRFHGSLIYAVKIASKLVDLIYVLSTKENEHIISKLKIRTAEFIPVTEFENYLDYADCILIGPGMGVSVHTKNLVAKALKSGKKVVLDADALNVMDKKLLNLLGPAHILTPHKSEFARLSKKFTNVKKIDKLVSEFVSRYKCTLVLKGKVDIVGSPTKGIHFNHTGNEGMTKGGTGDVLAGLIAAFFCKNDSFTSAAAGAYVNGLAGDELYKEVGPFFSAEDLVQQIPKTLWRLVQK